VCAAATSSTRARGRAPGSMVPGVPGRRRPRRPGRVVTPATRSPGAPTDRRRPPVTARRRPRSPPPRRRGRHRHRLAPRPLSGSGPLPHTRAPPKPSAAHRAPARRRFPRSVHAAPAGATPEQRTAALEKAALAGECGARSRPGLKLNRLSLPDLFAQSDNDDIVAKLKVVSVLESLPGVGKVRARRIMADLDIARAAVARPRRPQRARCSTPSPANRRSPGRPARPRRASRASARAPSVVLRARRTEARVVGVGDVASTARRGRRRRLPLRRAPSSSGCGTPAGSSSGSRSATAEGHPARRGTGPGRRPGRAARDRRPGRTGGREQFPEALLCSCGRPAAEQEARLRARVPTTRRWPGGWRRPGPRRRAPTASMPSW
jgi:hypothetical protein